MRYFAQAARLMLDPPAAAAELRASSPFWRSLAFAAALSLIYQATLAGLVDDALAIARLGGFDEGAASILWGHVRKVVPAAFGQVAGVAGVLVPACLLMLGSSGRAAGALATLREHYQGTGAAALSGYGVALAVSLAPAWLLGNPSVARAAATWSVLPLLPVVIVLGVAAAPVGDAGVGRAGLAAAAAAAPVVLFAFAGPMAAAVAGTAAAAAAMLVARALLAERARDAASRAAHARALATLAANPDDAAAHAAAGLGYQQAGDFDRAAEHLRRATTIDPSDVEALYQLGRVARQLGAHAEAIAAFDAVLQIDAHFAGGEVWREAGATYLAAAQPADALGALERFLPDHPSDVEGLYLHGLALDGVGDRDGARRRMLDVVEAARSAPRHAHGPNRRWLSEAEQYLKGDLRRG